MKKKSALVVGGKALEKNLFSKRQKFKTMKKVIFSTVFTLLTTLLVAQHETIFNNARVVGGFGGPLIEFGLNNDLNTSYGGGGGVVIGSAFIGGYGMGSVDLGDIIDGQDVENIEIGHGGFWLGYTYKPYKLVHLFSSAKIGWGAVNIDPDNFDPFDDDSFDDNIFVLTPELGLELNVFKWFRVGGTVGYRWVSGTDGDGVYDDGDFSGAVSTVTFRFGWFGNDRY